MRAGRKLIIRISELKDMAKQADETNVTSYGIVVTAVFAALFIAVSLLYKLNTVCKIILAAVGAALVPLVMFYHYYQKRENIRFNQTDVYIHQMAYSFTRNPKILNALKDTYSVAEGSLKEVLGRAVLCMESDDSSEVYRASLKIVEEAYPCDRVYTLHRFLISIEERGGDYSHPMSVLLEDFDRWVRRVYKFQEDMRHVKTNSLVGIIISCIIASVSVMISTMLDDTVEINMDITNLSIYQAETLIFLLMNIIYFVYTTIHYSRDWIMPLREDAAVLKDYRLAYSPQPRHLKAARFVILSVFIIFGAGLALMKKYIPASCVLAGGVILFFMPRINQRMAKERLKDDVYSGFSEWLREVALNLSHAPLQAAIQESYATCPAVIKPSLARFIYELDENPTDVTPYYTFLKEFKILDISSTVKTLYAVTENDTRNTGEVISTLISRKYEIADKHEASRNQNSLSAAQFAEYVPLLIVSAKLGVDMLLVITNYLAF